MLVASCVGAAHAAPRGCPEAEGAWSAGRYASAERLARACLDRAPEDSLAALALAHALGSQGRHAEALPWARKARAGLPGHQDAALWTLRLLFWGGDVEGARALLDTLPRSVDRAPDNLRLRADIAFARKDWDGAVLAYDAYLVERPLDTVARNNRGMSHAARGGADAAREDFQRSCELAGPGSDGCLLLRREGCPSADTLYRRGRGAEAEAAARACVQERPSDVGGWMSLSRALAALERFDEARGWAEKALASYPEDADLLLWKARLLAWTGHRREARGLLEAVPERAFADADNLRFRADLAFDLKDHEGALVDYEAWQHLRPWGDRAFFLRRGECRQVLGREEEARRDFERACELEGGGSEGCARAGRGGCASAVALWKAEALDEAERVARTCLEQDPDDVATWILMARVLGAVGRYSEAAAFLDRARARRVGDPSLEVFRARLLFWQGEVGWARSVLRDLPPEAPMDADTLRLAADLAFIEKDHAEAVRLYDLYLASPSLDLTALDNRGLAHAALGNRERALQDFQLACALGGEGSAGCEILEEQARKALRYRLFLQPGWAAIADRPDGQNLLGLFEARLTSPLLLGVKADARRRDFGAGPLTDTTLGAYGAWRKGSGFLLDAEMDVTPSASFSPTWAVWVEPGWALPGNTAVQLRLWRMNFTEGGVTLLCPALTAYRGPWILHGRYYLALDDALGPSHAGVARVSYHVSDPFLLHVGAGAGTRSDYLDLRRATSDGFVMALAGLSRDFGRFTLSLDDVVRVERVLEPDPSNPSASIPRRWLENDLLVGFGWRF
jgi:YaiO family outer membrane protein